MARYSISQPVNAVEAPRLLTGKGQFTDDIQIPHMAHAVFLRSPHAHADITRIDTDGDRFKFEKQYCRVHGFSYTILSDPTMVRRRILENVRGRVMPSPVGVAIEKDV